MTRRVPLLLALALGLAACAEPDDDADESPPPIVVLTDSSGEAPAPAAANTGAPTVLLAFEVFDERASIEPIALILPSGKLAYPPDDQTAPDGKAFEHAYYDPGTTYIASRGGHAAGQLEVIAPELAGCTGVPASAWLRVEATDDEPVVTRGIATSFDPGDNSFLVPATVAEDSITRATGDSILRARGVPEAYLSSAERDSVAVLVGAPSGRIIITGASVLVDTMQERASSLLFVLETVDSALTTTLVEYNDSTSDFAARSSFFDAFDLDRDGTPELIVRTNYYEHWDYAIYRRGPPWQRIYRGGGGGC